MPITKRNLWNSAVEINNHDSESNKAQVSGCNNTIYFFSDVDSSSILELCNQIDNLQSDLIGRAHKEKTSIENTPIYLYINSYGGSLLDGFAGMEFLRLCKVPIHTVIVGACASAATFLSIVGKRRVITENSFMMVHQLSGGFWGKYNEFKDDMKNMDLFMHTMKNIYNKYTHVPEEELEQILSRDIWWSPKQCLELGTVDEII